MVNFWVPDIPRAGFWNGKKNRYRFLGKIAALSLPAFAKAVDLPCFLV